MITLRPARERGHANHGWLESWHSFSFAGYDDPAHVHWGPLRVINEDRVAAGRGFGEHGHRDMEIISYVLRGALSHRDSLGNQATVVPGEVQRMSAGTGVQHAEYNGDRAGTTHFLQIWLMPNGMGVAPSYEQKAFPDADKRGALRLVAAGDGRAGAVTIHQDADLYASLLAPGGRVKHRLAPGRHAFVHLVRGALTLNGTALATGDGAAVSDEADLELAATAESEVLLFDLA